MVLSSYLYDIWAADLLSKWSSDIWSTCFLCGDIFFRKSRWNYVFKINFEVVESSFINLSYMNFSSTVMYHRKWGSKCVIMQKVETIFLKIFLDPERAQKIELYQSSFNSPKRTLPTHIVLKRHYFLVKILYWRNAEIAL